LINFKSIANPKIEGTHKPIKIPASFSPLNHKTSEKIREEKAATNISVSENVNFLNIFFIYCNLLKIINM
jgi:hypothetical protein